MEKILVHQNERVVYDRKDMTPELIALLEDLKKKLSEQDMVLSIFQSLTGVSNDVYRVIKDDYRTAYQAATAVKNKVGQAVMERYEAEFGVLSWSFSSIDENLTVYCQ